MLFGAVAAVSAHGELEGLEGDQAEETVQEGSGFNRPWASPPALREEV